MVMNAVTSILYDGKDLYRRPWNDVNEQIATRSSALSDRRSNRVAESAFQLVL